MRCGKNQDHYLFPITHARYPSRHFFNGFQGSFSRESAVWHHNSKAEIHLFTLLKKAYVDARYNDKYVITEDELNALIERVKKLQEIGETICKNKIASIV